MVRIAPPSVNVICEVANSAETEVTKSGYVAMENPIATTCARNATATIHQPRKPALMRAGYHGPMRAMRLSTAAVLAAGRAGVGREPLTAPTSDSEPPPMLFGAGA